MSVTSSISNALIPSPDTKNDANPISQDESVDSTSTLQDEVEERNQTSTRSNLERLAIMTSAYPIWPNIVNRLNQEDLDNLRAAHPILAWNLEPSPRQLGTDNGGCQASSRLVMSRNKDKDHKYIMEYFKCPFRDPRQRTKLYKCEGWKYGWAATHGKEHWYCQNEAIYPASLKTALIRRIMRETAEAYCKPCSKDLMEEAQKSGIELPLDCDCMQDVAERICRSCQIERCRQLEKKAEFYRDFFYATAQEFHQHTLLPDLNHDTGCVPLKNMVSNICPGCLVTLLPTWLESDIRTDCVSKCLVCQKNVREKKLLTSSLESHKKISLHGSLVPHDVRVRGPDLLGRVRCVESYDQYMAKLSFDIYG